ncbi:hypothetical protein ABZ322_13670 [Streptomyces sp. NPDC006129]|uniref:hypothetical protein n=1 Tax=Streptomyces sp. NPDC006129 TaxID=3155348 RepID=UPI0033A38271
MDTYSHAYGNTGHYRRPGTQTSYCGRDLLPEPNTGICAKICQPCAKAEKRDRVEAEQVAADRAVDGPSLAERAGVRYATVGTGRRVHYSPSNDDTLCGREVSEYVDGEDLLALLNKGHQLCVPCDRAAEKRAYARSLAAASPLAAAAVDLADTVEQADAEQAPADESATVPGALVDPWTWIRRPSSSDAAQAAEERAERRQQLADSRGANAYELAEVAVRQFVREMPKAGALRVRVTEGSPEATLARDDLHALAYSGHTTADAVARVRAAVAAHIRHGEREVHIMFPALGMRPALYLPDVMALLINWEHTQADAVEAAVEQFDRTAHAVDAVEHAEQVEAGVATVEDAEALYATRAVTEAEAADGTWRGAWIGEQADDALFAIEPAVEQGALFAPGSRVAVEGGAEPVVVRMTPARADLARIRAKAAADREEYRARMDERQAAEHRAHGAPVPAAVQARIDARAQQGEQAPARRVIEGVVVSHGGTTQGSMPKDATNPDVIAAREALAGLAVATLTDHHDVTEPAEDERDTRGYFVDPRTHGRVAVYWLEGGRIVRRDDPAHGPALDCLADRLKRRGWAVEKMLRSSQCVFAYRPSAD